MLLFELYPYPQNSDAESEIPSTSECDRGFKEVIKFK